MTRLATLAGALSLALFLIMAWYSHMVLVPAAGGLLPFDARAWGYAPEAAQSYLQALDGAGRAVYLLEMRWLDGVFMLSFALTLGLGMLFLARPLPVWVRSVLLLPVLAYLAADWAENASVGELLQRGPEGFVPLLATWASLFTRLKFALLLLCLLILAGLWQRSRREG
ncbi:hypothetical protein M4578_02270 [Salipiger sp. P9]|uniref:hypothetical protein n=1 Tax=Salipiger pentaromativorans TaxID=2943193 RepID=UPI0021584A8A|nr:hypothetical protein [Salipiger pentaromativorans]MCR8546639.1 hypothetical protein [Salipiger pentaromativorans]